MQEGQDYREISSQISPIIEYSPQRVQSTVSIDMGVPVELRLGETFILVAIDSNNNLHFYDRDGRDYSGRQRDLYKIGRDSGNDIVIPNDVFVSRNSHASIWVNKQDDQVMLTDSSTNGTFYEPVAQVNPDFSGKVIAPANKWLRVSLQEGLPVNLNFGNTTVSLKMGTERGRQVYRLNVAGRIIELTEGAIYRVGRSPENNILLPDPTVSKNHVLIGVVNGQLLVMDRRSTNGTIIENPLKGRLPRVSSVTEGGPRETADQEVDPMIKRQVLNRKSEGTTMLVFKQDLAAGTDKGLQREHNEDMCLVMKDKKGSTILAIADGAGGHAAGEVAAERAIIGIKEGVAQGLDLETAIRRANEDILHYNQANNADAGTTVTVATIDADRRLTVYNVGDSPAYVYRSGQLIPVFYDDSMVARLVRAGQLTPEEAFISSQKNIILASLGGKSPLNIHKITYQLQPGDVVLLASDGLEYISSNLGTSQALSKYKTVLKNVLGNKNLTPSQKVQELIRLAKLGGGNDNITVIVMEIE